jgi:cation:H+ antiporter
MVTNLLLLIVSLVILVVGAEGLVRGASRLALRLGVSAFVVGVTVVGFGTSTPELAASLSSVISGHSEIALGNVVGSNIMNIALVLGVTAIIKPIPVKLNLVRRETIVVILVSLLPFLALMSGGVIERWLGGIFLLLLVAFLYWTWRTSRREGGAPEEIQVAEVSPPTGPVPVFVELLLIVIGIIMLAFGANMLVDSATELARAFGVSELVIGLTIVAGGTSAPELVTSLMAILRGKADLSVGNVLGSCIFNILGILGITAVVVPIEIPSSVFFFDLPVMVILALACLPFFFSGGRISRVEGAVLLAIWMAYTVLLYVGWPAKSLDSDTDSSIQPPPSTTRSQ